MNAVKVIMTGKGLILELSKKMKSDKANSSWKVKRDSTNLNSNNPDLFVSNQNSNDSSCTLFNNPTLKKPSADVLRNLRRKINKLINFYKIPTSLIASQVRSFINNVDSNYSQYSLRMVVLSGLPHSK